MVTDPVTGKPTLIGSASPGFHSLGTDAADLIWAILRRSPDDNMTIPFTGRTIKSAALQLLTLHCPVDHVIWDFVRLYNENNETYITYEEWVNYCTELPP